FRPLFRLTPKRLFRAAVDSPLNAESIGEIAVAISPVVVGTALSRVRRPKAWRIARRRLLDRSLLSAMPNPSLAPSQGRPRRRAASPGLQTGSAKPCRATHRRRARSLAFLHISK